MPIDASLWKSLPLFAGLNSTEVEELAAQMTPKKVAAGQTIIREKDAPGLPMYVLLAGSVDIVKQGVDQRAHVIANLSAPSVFGEIELLACRPAIASVVAATDVSLALLHRGVFEELVAAVRPAVMKVVRNLAQTLSYRLAATDERLAAFASVASGRERKHLGQMQSLLYSGWNV
jgi:CRP-like cAMP-binding protein